MRFERILLATDLSAPSRPALEHAAAIAARSGGRLYVLHAVELAGSALAPIASATEGSLDRLFDRVEERLSLEVSAREAAPAPSRSAIVECVRIGPADVEVAAFALEKDVDLIVVGTHGRSGLERLLAGSVAESILRRAPCPVLVAREGDATSREPRAPLFRRALVAIDFSTGSRAALRVAGALAAFDEGTLDVVHVVEDDVLVAASRFSAVDPLDVQESLFEVSRTNLERLVEETPTGTRGRARVRIERGRAAETISALARDGGYDLIACGTHGRSGLRRALFGSVAEEVVRAARCPAVVVREGRASTRWLEPAAPGEGRPAA